MASSVIYAITPKAVEGNLGANTLGAGMSAVEGCILEGVLTFALLAVISSVTHKQSKVGNLAPLSIGLAVAWAHFFAVS